jgi:hypothetical protein
VSDEALRSLERRAVDDPEAAAALARAQCRAHGHDIIEGGIMFRIEQRPDGGFDAGKSEAFQRCRRCKDDVPWRPEGPTLAEMFAAREKAILDAVCGPTPEESRATPARRKARASGRKRRRR